MKTPDPFESGDRSNERLSNRCVLGPTYYGEHERYTRLVFPEQSEDSIQAWG